MKAILNIDEAADFVGLAKSTLYKRVCRNRIPYLKIGSRILFESSALLRWARSHAISPIVYVDQDTYQGEDDAA